MGMNHNIAVIKVYPYRGGDICSNPNGGLWLVLPTSVAESLTNELIRQARDMGLLPVVGYPNHALFEFLDENGKKFALKICDFSVVLGDYVEPGVF